MRGKGGGSGLRVSRVWIVMAGGVGCIKRCIKETLHNLGFEGMDTVVVERFGLLTLCRMLKEIYLSFYIHLEGRKYLLAIGGGSMWYGEWLAYCPSLSLNP